MSDDDDTKDFSNLTEREVKILRERFGIDLEADNSLEEIEKQFRVTRERIRQIEAKALRKLRASKTDPKCSFCGKRASQVTRMIRSNYTDAHICDECLKTSMELIDE